jgi:hypothetical protein
MKDLNRILENINSAVERYEIQKLSLTQDQSEILRDLSVNFHWLAEHKIDANKKWNWAYFNSKEKSVAGKERQADFEVPEMYTIRQMLASSKVVLDSIRSTISTNKQQQS